MKLVEVLGVFLRGLAMGAADVVPGVSGGTIAFITGIYSRLIGSLTSFDLEAINLVLQLKFAEVWKHVDANFLLALFAGILCSILSLAHLISYLLEHFPVLLWSFFSGLIFASAIWMLMGCSKLKPADAMPLVAGVALIYLVAISPAAAISPSLPIIFMAGFIAISAMLLPGVSGSFLLLLMGLYTVTIEAVKTLDLPYLVVFAAGAGCGFLVFSRVIKWLLSRFYRQTLLFLIGLLIGSMYVVWPWKQVNGDFSQNLSPSAYADLIGEPMLIWSLLSAAVGIAIVFSFEFFFGRKDGVTQATDAE